VSGIERSRDIEFIVCKGKTVDWYLFTIECHELRTYKQGSLIAIRHSTIQDINGDSILFRFAIERYKQKSNKDWKEINSRTHDFWIESNRLDGELICEIED